MDGAEDRRQDLGVVRIALELHQLAVQLIEILVALDQEFLDQLFLLVLEVAHPSPSAGPQAQVIGNLALDVVRASLLKRTSRLRCS